MSNRHQIRMNFDLDAEVFTSIELTSSELKALKEWAVEIVRVDGSDQPRVLYNVVADSSELTDIIVDLSEQAVAILARIELSADELQRLVELVGNIACRLSFLNATIIVEHLTVGGPIAGCGLRPLGKQRIVGSGDARGRAA